MKAGKVYFVSAPGRIKIGYTTQPEVRLAHLQATDMERLEVIGVVDGLRSDEKALHERLDSHRLRGEWFLDNDEVRGVVSLFISGKLKFVRKTRDISGIDAAHIEVSALVLRASLDELRTLGDDIFERALRREPTGDLRRMMLFLSEKVVGPLLGSSKEDAAEIAPEILEQK
jgi:hypothetical protein